jgi:hypothetical protein
MNTVAKVNTASTQLRRNNWRAGSNYLRHRTHEHLLASGATDRRGLCQMNGALLGLAWTV